MRPSSKTQRAAKIYSPKKRFAIAQRRPWRLPETEIQLEAPDPMPAEPANVSWVGLLLPPLLMVGSMGAYALMFKGGNRWIMLPMALMGLGFPIANIFSTLSERKRYKLALEERQENYARYLQEMRQKAEALARQQLTIFQQEYPDVEQVLEWALPGRKKSRLWWRRPDDRDFLSLRVGLGSVPAAFQITLPNFSDAKDPLRESAMRLVMDFQTISGMPILVDLKRAGSLAVSGRARDVQGVLYHFLIDIMFHHAPQDVELMVLDPEGKAAAQRWGWLKWAPHTLVLEGRDVRPHLAFDRQRVDDALEWVMKEYYRRKKRQSDEPVAGRSIVVFVGKSHALRRSLDIVELADEGHSVGIYVVFVGGSDVPRECRAQLRIKQNLFEYMETWAVEEDPLTLRGSVELAARQQAEKLARILASLEPSSNRRGEERLPDRVSLFDVLEITAVDQEEMVKRLQANWERMYRPREQLQFPFGVYFDRRRGLKPAMLNLLPEKYGGIGAYHSILVGTTGSGKSEFMKTLVLAAAYRYSPRQLNFFFMDFKGGSAFNIFQSLPHTVGVVTNLSPELVERGLNAIEYELEARQKRLAEANVSNIWEYNESNASQPMPHLLLLLDEFARGMEDFEQLPDLLNRLVRIGRSLGMYLFLANQDVNAAVDRLLNNVGWRIALKVARPEEMGIIDRRLPIAERGKGEGYLFSTLSPDGEPPMKFQAGYAGFTVYGKRDAAFSAYKVYEVRDDGHWTVFEEIKTSAAERGEEVTEQDLVLNAARQILEEQKDLKPQPVYLEPLPEHIPLSKIFKEASPAQAFNVEEERWQPVEAATPWAIPVGKMDSPEQRFQDVLRVDFNDKDGHLWILGAPDSGVEDALRTLLLSLALLKTPQEAQIYVIEGGAGRLRDLESLPHIGAMVRLKENERVERLLKFLDEEIERRAVSYETGWPHLFLVIDGYAAFRNQFEENDRIAQYAQMGKSVGLHLIVTTNRRMDLWSGVADNIARRLVLYLSSPDEYYDALDARVKPFARVVRGKGYWRDDQVYLCQIASPEVQTPEKTYNARHLAEVMKQQWGGPRPRPIGVLPSCLPLSVLMRSTVGSDENLVLPLGVSFEDLQPLLVDVDEVPAEWFVLGARRTGKSNFLNALATMLVTFYETEVEVFLLRFRGGKAMALPPTVRVYQKRNLSDGVQAVREYVEKQTGKRVFVLLDDLGVALGKDVFKDEIGSWISFDERWQDVHIVASGVVGDLQPHMMHPLVRRFRQNRTGIVLGKDTDALSWVSAQFPRQYRQHRFPVGRGFWVSGGQPILVQVPLVGECQE